MFGHLILGLLRDGRLRHGYDLVSEHKTRSGTQTNPGNFYRELANLSAEGLIETGVNPPQADARRIPYRITDAGRREFDGWLLSPSTQDEELPSWLLFVDLVPPDLCAALLDRLKEQLWLQSKSLTRAREDALVYGRMNGHGGKYNSAAALLLRRLRQVTADLDFLEELRRELEYLR
jgi:DNA-binding PadR family transcriptional regulator